MLALHSCAGERLYQGRWHNPIALGVLVIPTRPAAPCGRPAREHPDRIAILPGGFMTEPNQRWSKLHPEVIERFRANIPLGDFGQPEDLGPLALYLASDASRYMTGAALVIDGGYTLW